MIFNKKTQELFHWKEFLILETNPLKQERKLQRSLDTGFVVFSVKHVITLPAWHQAQILVFFTENS